MWRKRRSRQKKESTSLLMFVPKISNLVFPDFAGDQVIINKKVSNSSTLLRPFFVCYKSVHEGIKHFPPFCKSPSIYKKAFLKSESLSQVNFAKFKTCFCNIDKMIFDVERIKPQTTHASERHWSLQNWVIGQWKQSSSEYGIPLTSTLKRKMSLYHSLRGNALW